MLLILTCFRLGDGCICFFSSMKDMCKISFFLMRQVKEMGTFQSIYTNLASESQLSSSYTAMHQVLPPQILSLGTLENETKVIEHMQHMNWPFRINSSANQQFQTFISSLQMAQVSCGGWQRLFYIFLLSWENPRISELFCISKGLTSKFLYLCFVDLFSQLMFQ